MDSKLQQQLFEKYPKIFRQKDLSLRETCMCFGCDCGDGWFKLLDILCSHLQFNTDKNRYPQVEATQVKEKFGGLRFYYTVIPLDKEESMERYWGIIDGLVSFAEDISNYICEKCGSMDNVTQTKGWIVTLCEKCMEERNKE